MNFRPNRKIILKLIKIIPFWKIPLSAAMIFSAAGVFHFWDHPAAWTHLLYSFLITVLVLICAFWLQLRIALSKTMIPAGETFSIINFPQREKIELDEKETIPTLNFLLVISAILLTMLFLSMMHFADSLTGFNLYFGIVLITVFLFAYSGSLSSVCWVEEVLDSFLTVAAPVLLLLNFQRYAPAELTLQGYVIPIFFLFLSFRFVLAMIQVDHQAGWTPGFFSIAIDKKFYRIHHLFILLAFIAVILFNLSGVPWRLQWRQLLLFPTLALQIIWVERIFNGLKPEWKFAGWLSYGNILLWAYFQIVTIWFRY